METNHTSNLGRARLQVGVGVLVVCGAALKLALAGDVNSNSEHRRIDAGMTVYHWKMHSIQVVGLAETLRLVLAPT